MTTEITAAVSRKLPLLRGYTQEFYAWCAKGEMRFQRCAQCGVWRHPPRPMCAACHSMAWAWTPTAGRAKVYCWTVVEQALDPAFAAAVPYAVAIVELDEGPRLATWVTGIPPAALTIGLPVEVWFDPLTDGVALPKFKPVAWSPG